MKTNTENRTPRGYIYRNGVSVAFFINKLAALAAALLLAKNGGG
jgi:hypothetical protein